MEWRQNGKGKIDGERDAEYEYVVPHRESNPVSYSMWGTLELSRGELKLLGDILGSLGCLV